MAIADPQTACVIALQHDPTILSEQERIERFIAATRCSRATYFRTKSRLEAIGYEPIQHPLCDPKHIPGRREVDTDASEGQIA
jgi:hypothetical protein